MDDRSDAGDVFMVRARRCKRCGGLLTSRQAVADGYGHTCLMKERGEQRAKAPLPGQMFIFGDEMPKKPHRPSVNPLYTILTDFAREKSEIFINNRKFY